MAARAANTVSEHGAEGGAVAGGWKAKSGDEGETLPKITGIDGFAEHTSGAELK